MWISPPLLITSQLDILSKTRCADPPLPSFFLAFSLDGSRFLPPAKRLLPINTHHPVVDRATRVDRSACLQPTLLYPSAVLILPRLPPESSGSHAPLTRIYSAMLPPGLFRPAAILPLSRSARSPPGFSFSPCAIGTSFPLKGQLDNRHVI